MRYECLERDYMLSQTGTNPMQSQEDEDMSTVAGSDYHGVALNLAPISQDAFNPVPPRLQNELHLPNMNEFPIHPDITQPPGKICTQVKVKCKFFDTNM